MQAEGNLSKMCPINWKIQPRLSQKNVPQIEPVSIVDTILHRRYVPRSRYYFCSGHEHLKSVRNVNDKQPFILPPNNEFHTYLHNLKVQKQNELQESRKSKHKITNTYHTSESSDILRRLHVDQTSDVDQTNDNKISEMNAITDIDPDYFTELNGRTVDERFSLKDLINDTKDILRTNILIDLRKYEVNLIDDVIAKQTKKMKRSKMEVQLFASCFDEFLAENDRETTAIKNELEKEVNKTKMLEEKHVRLIEASKKIRREIHNLGKPWKQLKMCQQFLYKISPESWRQEHDSNIDYVSQKDVTPSDDVDQLNISKDFTLDILIERIAKEVTQAKPPTLYFQHPIQLIRTFNAIEMQKLNALTHQDLLSEMIEQINDFVNKMQNEVETEIHSIKNEIKQLETSIASTKTRADNLELFATTVLHEVFDNLLNSKSILLLQVCIEDVYNKCVHVPDLKLSSLSKMKFIEQTYEKLNLQIDKYPKDIVSNCERDYRLSKKKRERDAIEEERQVKRMERLLIVLKRIMEPPKKPRRRVMWRSKPPAEKIVKVPPPSPLTQEEILYLDLFTECNKYDVNIQHRALVPTELIQQMKERREKPSK